MRWPRCNMLFFIKDEDEPGMRTWRMCTRAWGHWLQRMPDGKHMGPVMASLPREFGKPRKI